MWENDRIEMGSDSELKFEMDIPHGGWFNFYFKLNGAAIVDMSATAVDEVDFPAELIALLTQARGMDEGNIYAVFTDDLNGYALVIDKRNGLYTISGYGLNKFYDSDMAKAWRNANRATAPSDYSDEFYRDFADPPLSCRGSDLPQGEDDWLFMKLSSVSQEQFDAFLLSVADAFEPYGNALKKEYMLGWCIGGGGVCGNAHMYDFPYEALDKLRAAIA